MDPAEPEDPGSLRSDHPGSPPTGVPGSPQNDHPGQLQAADSGPLPEGQPGGGSPPAPPDPDGKSPDGKSPSGRRRKILTWTAGILTVIVVIGTLGAYFVYRHLNGNLHQVDISGVLGSQPVDLHPQAENILVLGSDTRSGQGRGFGSSAELNTDHSDTLLIVHIPADRKWADIMSIPRDSWVSIPACLMGNGQTSSATTFKINEAFTLGNLDGNKTDLGVA